MPNRLHCICPYCAQRKGCSEAPPNGLMERTLLRALGFRPYRCSACGHHRILFVGLGMKAETAEMIPEREVPSVPPAHEESSNRDFQTLIQDIRRQEESLLGPRKEASKEGQALPWKKGGSTP